MARAGDGCDHGGDRGAERNPGDDDEHGDGSLHSVHALSSCRDREKRVNVDSQGSLGHRIRATRISRGLSQAQLALPELSDSYVSLIESGKRVPTPDVVRLLARKLGCS